MVNISVFLALCLFSLSVSANVSSADNVALPGGFVYVTDVIPDAILDIRYYGTNNFVGERIDSYLAPQAILSREAVMALKRSADDLRKLGYVIKIFDAYRPASAVAHFVRWARDARDVRQKKLFYPDVEKADLFRLGYIAERSGHSRGSTVDLTIADAATGVEVDMGAPFDYFGKISSAASNRITPTQRKNRQILQKAMVSNGFKPISAEWWHFTLVNEPFQDTYFDFPVDR
jgi:D-alanyl-D-alanine dipeptidase